MFGKMMQTPPRGIDLLRHANRNHPRTVIARRYSEGAIHRYTYGEAYFRACRLTRALDGLRVGQNTRVAALASSEYQYVEPYYACAGIGAACDALNQNLSSEKDAIVSQAEVERILLSVEDLAPLLEGIWKQPANVHQFLMMDEISGSCAVAASIVRLLFYDDLIAGGNPVDLDWLDFDGNQLCGRCNTSCITGQPKGVCYFHRSTVLRAYAGPVDVCTDGAAGKFVDEVASMSTNGFRTVIDINLIGTSSTFRAASRHLRVEASHLLATSAVRASMPTSAQAHAGLLGRSLQCHGASLVSDTERMIRLCSRWKLQLEPTAYRHPNAEARRL